MSERTRETREAIAQHASLPLLKRLGRRMIGKYPSKDDREALRRSDIGPSNRIAEDVLEAIDWTRKLSHTPAAVLGGRWMVGTEMGDNKPATIPVELQRANDIEVAKQLFQAGREETTTSQDQDIDAVGFYVDEYGKFGSPRFDAPSIGRIGLIGFKNFNAVDSVFISKGSIDALEPVLQEGLEFLASTVKFGVRQEYILNRPERTG